MIDDANLWMVDSLDGTWFNIDCIELIPESYIDNLYLISNNKKVNEVIYKTRSATMYVICDIELRTKEIV